MLTEKGNRNLLLPFLFKLNTTRQLNNEEISFINGGQNSVKPSRRWDSEKQDSKKHDDHTKTESV